MAAAARATAESRALPLVTVGAGGSPPPSPSGPGLRVDSDRSPLVHIGTQGQGEMEGLGSPSRGRPLLYDTESPTL
eukprot:7994229-Alexandrium_andersonii.AAC.1